MTGLICGNSAALFFFIAGMKFMVHCNRMSGLESVSGRTVAEAYYQQMDHFGIAFGYSLIALALLASALTTFLSFPLTQSSRKPDNGRR
jgi:hypothetical protein